MSWRKVTFTLGQGVDKTTDKFDSLIKAVYAGHGHLEDYYKTVEYDESGNHLLVWYFSPSAAQCCQKILDAYGGGEPCDKPSCA